MFSINSRTAWFYLDQFPNSKNLRDYVPHCLVACGDRSIDVKGRSGISSKALDFRHFSTLGGSEQVETVIALW